MSAYAIRYVDRAAQRKAALNTSRAASLEDLEKRLSRHVVINVIDLVAV
ncbi:hypothetical protein [Streptomyces sp. V4I2]|nr:hypothetical protein [Streptomyces sp. V4I2]MDQ1046699.1 hypothetical protein [Streptomyces sp. V4I2]